jgi:phosphosulfolactate synthase (CoM biosynthesis protein A)
MKYCITVEQISGSQKSHAVHFFNNWNDAHTSFVQRCDELGYDYTELPDGTALMSAGGFPNDYRIELMNSNFGFLTNEDEEVVS